MIFVFYTFDLARKCTSSLSSLQAVYNHCYRGLEAGTTNEQKEQEKREEKDTVLLVGLTLKYTVY